MTFVDRGIEKNMCPIRRDQRAFCFAAGLTAGPVPPRPRPFRFASRALVTSEMEPNYGAGSEFKAKEALIPVLRLADLGARWSLDPSDLRRFRAELCRFDVGLGSL